MQSKFKSKFTLEDRKKYAAFAKTNELVQSRKMIPIILENCQGTPCMDDRFKHVVQEDLPISLVRIHILRKMGLHLHVLPRLCLIVQEQVFHSSKCNVTVGDLYNKYVDEDGFLYIFYELKIYR